MYHASLAIPEKGIPKTADRQVTDNLPAKWHALDPYVKAPSELPYAKALVQRRSKRNFVDRPIPRRKAFNLLQLLVGALQPGNDANAGLQLGFLSGNVEDVAPGFYLLDGQARKYGCVKEEQLTLPMASVCLDQQWLKNAGLQFVFMINLKHVDRKWGARGYRYAMLEAGRLGQCLYLGATALGLGCCGIGALYDDEARSLLALNAHSALLYLVAVGRVRG